LLPPCNGGFGIGVSDPDNNASSHIASVVVTFFAVSNSFGDAVSSLLAIGRRQFEGFNELLRRVGGTNRPK
jgi:hypothetical protein